MTVPAAAQQPNQMMQGPALQKNEKKNQPAEQPKKQTETTTKKSESTSTATPAEYRYIAQAGDSYSLLARKAVQTYGIVNKVQLTPAEIVMAETNLTLQAGSPDLQTGQAMAISSASVKDWATRAQAVSAEEEAAWSEYTSSVYFNTNHVGETNAQ